MTAVGPFVKRAGLHLAAPAQELPLSVPHENEVLKGARTSVHLEHDFPERLVRLNDSVSLWSLLEWEHSIDDGAKPPESEEWHEASFKGLREEDFLFERARPKHR